MKKFVLIVGALLLVGCGPSGPSKEEASGPSKEEAKAAILEYIAANIQTTYLFCPEGDGEYKHVGTGGENPYYFIQLNKVDDKFWIRSKQEGYEWLQEPVYSKVYLMFDLESHESYDNKSIFGGVKLGETIKDPHNGDRLRTYYFGYIIETSVTESHWNKYESSKSFGHKVLEFNTYPLISLLLDRVDLRAAPDEYRIGRSGYADFMCEYSSKEIFDKKLKEQEDLVKAAADAYKAEVAERQSEEPQI